MKKIVSVFIFCISFSLSAAVLAGGITKWSLPKAKKPDEEFLLYRLSYSGFLTAFVWKDLADTVLSADSAPSKFNGQKSCRLHLRMSTENFLLAESFSPMRYHWRTTINPDLSRIFLIEEINENDDDLHRVVWLNRNKNQIEIYRKRKKMIPQFDENEEYDFYDDNDADLAWEKDGKKQPPDFLVENPKIEDGLNYLIYDKAIKIEKNGSVFDPLSLIYSARWYDYGKVGDIDFVVSHKDGFRQYKVFFEDKEIVEIGSKSVNTLKIVIRRHKKESGENEGFMAIWLTDDERRLPVQYLVEAKLGEIRLKINALNFENYQAPVNCVVHK
ncbi:hypothetical protein MNBD_GAMMA06-1612 [hydrothermal vent metagenome]|uniref:DUF3108 domain-containing protein n=1 Tax=hydrothermal vent metagenome TaxID=652676 RepID=A0A3B0WJX1_9ZZZZ